MCLATHECERQHVPCCSFQATTMHSIYVMFDFLSCNRNLLSFSNLSAEQCIQPRGRSRTQPTLLVQFNHTRWTSLGALNLKHPWAALWGCWSAARNKLCVEHCTYALPLSSIRTKSHLSCFKHNKVDTLLFGNALTSINKFLIYNALASQFYIYKHDWANQILQAHVMFRATYVRHTIFN